MMRLSTATALFGAVALLFGAAQVRADIISPCVSATAQLSDCLWLGDELGTPLAGSSISLPEPDGFAPSSVLTPTFPTAVDLPGPIALLEPPGSGSNHQVVSDLIFFDFNNQQRTQLVVTLMSDTEQALTLPADARTFVETGKPQDVFKFELPGSPAVHVWVLSDVEPIPEPATVLSMLAGLAALTASRWLRKRA